MGLLHLLQRLEGQHLVQLVEKFELLLCNANDWLTHLLFLSILGIVSLLASDRGGSELLESLPVGSIPKHIPLVLSLKDSHDIYKNLGYKKGQNVLTLLGLSEDFGW